MSGKKKGETVHMKTFKKWPFMNDFTVECDEVGWLLELRCKICTEKYQEIRKEAKSRKISGPPLDSIINYIDGVKYIHKANVMKHIKNGSLHAWAKEKFYGGKGKEVLS